jgi:O-antigen/teichoic acid export membrane protein
LAIPLVQSEADAANVLGLCCLIVLLMASLAAIVLIIAGDTLSEALGVPALQPFLLLIPIATIVIGFHQPLAWWAARRRHYKHSSASQILRSAGSASVQIAFGAAKGGPPGLILGSIIGQLVAVGFLAAQVWRKDSRLIAASLSVKGMLRLARDQRDFPKFTMPRAVLLSMTEAAPPLLLAMYFNTAVAGAYWLASRVCQLPIVFLGDAVRQVFYERAAAQFNRREALLAFLTMSTIGLAIFIIAPFAIMILYAPELYAFVFGEEWVRAGIYCQWLIMPWLLNFVCTPSATLVWTFGYQRLLLIFEGLTLVPRLAIIPLISLVGSDVTAIAAYSLAGAIFQLCILIFVFLHTWRHQTSMVHAASAKA